MTLTDDRKKLLSDLALGKIISGKMNWDAQFAALRKQLILVSEALKVPLDPDFQALEDLVASEKAKKEKKVETVKPAKKTTKKSK